MTAIDDETFSQLKDAIERFVKERLVPNELKVEEADEIPASLVEEMKELGLFGLTISPEFGGIGLTCRQESEVAMILGQTAPAFRSLFGTNIGIGARGLILEGTEEQKEAYCRN